MFQRFHPSPRQQLSRISPILLFAILLTIFGSMDLCRAANSVWGGLIYAKNVSEPTAAPGEIRQFEEKLKRIFGYNQFEILGQQIKDVEEKGDRWLIPGHDFSVLATLEKQTSKGCELQIQLFQGKRLLVNTRAKLGVASPLIIRGPLYADGQLLIVLEIR